MVVAAVMVHAKVGFFMNWSGAQPGEGYEYHLLAGAMALLIVLKGSGAYSADRVIAAKA
jgi:putative oxidoreductase